MANFDPPFSNAADKRFPTSDERQSGFPCGPADQQLFNGMFHRIEAELGDLIAYAGLTPVDSDLTQTRKAVLALIAAATGGGDPADYLLLAQARGRLPIFPDVQNVDGRIGITAPSTGTIRVPGGVTFLHRGIFPVTTAQEDFATAASKIYHLRWRPDAGFVLLETGDATYNPTSLAETDAAFDSKYDDMLVARIITNASNIATITNLRNQNRILLEVQNNGNITTAPGSNLAERTAQFSWNLARRPVVAVHPTSIAVSSSSNDNTGGFTGSMTHDHDFEIARLSIDRYGGTYRLLRDYSTRFDAQATVMA